MVHGVAEDVEDREDAGVVVVDGDGVVEEVSKGLGKRGGLDFYGKRLSWGSMAVKSMLENLRSGEEKSYAWLGITGVCG